MAHREGVYDVHSTRRGFWDKAVSRRSVAKQGVPVLRIGESAYGQMGYNAERPHMARA